MVTRQWILVLIRSLFAFRQQVSGQKVKYPQNISGVFSSLTMIANHYSQHRSHDWGINAMGRQALDIKYMAHPAKWYPTLNIK